jgi:hypothetical protein
VAAADADDPTVTSSVVPPAAPVPLTDAAPRARRRFSPLMTLVAIAALVVIPLAISAFLGANRAGSPALSVTPTPTVAATAAATTTPTPAPTATFDFGTLPRPVQRAIERYREACGQDAPLPEGIESMNKKAAEDALDPLTEACQG